MGWFSKKPKCVFCDRKNGFFHSVHAYGIYGELGERLYYHPECLSMVEMDPEKFGHKMVDKALHLNELKERNDRNCNNQIVATHEKEVAKLQQQNFERMMPKRPVKPKFPPPRGIKC